jgi:pyruvate/2-oxoglutarate dehydrogenase complex dihydrolipoamide dehydrogenase (E3) component
VDDKRDSQSHGARLISAFLRIGRLSNVEEFEIMVLGSGEARKYLTWMMAREGHRAALVERRWLGGSCANIACLPSKNLIYSARVASLASRG